MNVPITWSWELLLTDTADQVLLKSSFICRPFLVQFTASTVRPLKEQLRASLMTFVLIGVMTQPKLYSDKQIFAKTEMKQKLGLLFTSLNRPSSNRRVSVLTLHPNMRRVVKGKIFPWTYSRLLSELEFLFLCKLSCWKKLAGKWHILVAKRLTLGGKINKKYPP